MDMDQLKASKFVTFKGDFPHSQHTHAISVLPQEHNAVNTQCMGCHKDSHSPIACDFIYQPDSHTVHLRNHLRTLTYMMALQKPPKSYMWLRHMSAVLRKLHPCVQCVLVFSKQLSLL